MRKKEKLEKKREEKAFKKRRFEEASVPEQRKQKCI